MSTQPEGVSRKRADIGRNIQEKHLTDSLAVRVEYFFQSSPQDLVRSFFVEELKVNPLKIEFGTEWRKQAPSEFCLLHYSDIESAYKAVRILEGVCFSGQELKAFIQLNGPTALCEADSEISESDEVCLKDETAKECPETKEKDDIIDRTIPKRHVPYIKQLVDKQRHMHKILRKTCKKIYHVGDSSVIDWLELEKEDYKELPCELLAIRASGIIREYRNKCEFTIGKNFNGQDILIGFTLRKLSETKKLEYVPVGPIDDLIHIPRKMKDVVKVLQDYVKSSGIEPYNPWNRVTCWSFVTVRVNGNGDVMVIMTIEARDLPKVQLQTIKKGLGEWFQDSGRKAGVTSLYCRAVYPKVKGSGSEDEICHLSGERVLEEKLCNLNFEISADAFFQVNTKAAEILYRTALALARVDKDTTVLDVCCGTGTIGIFFSQFCGEVLGVESVESAVLNARENAKRNGASNCEFFHGKAEELLGPLIRRATKPKIVAIVDPPRAGLHKRAIWSLRREERISRVIYISCAPQAAMVNVVNLARASSKAYKGEPFVPVEAVPVDMFPHTEHCELVLSLERVPLAIESRKLKLEKQEAPLTNPKEETRVHRKVGHHPSCEPSASKKARTIHSTAAVPT